ncbi:PAS domain-containing protein [Hyalangium sp.]|uniref:PAS domain-containing protein n=1 Tax=Hyalangium sp. TaxID=2028555 RepID=UPI002D470889|nr:PAS domain-containing protein [Hyalangium sp.]HYH98238.1 PAS domain-containing protein [Hyalangium sp.]
MSGNRSPAPDLVGFARQIFSLLSAEDVLVHACREARSRTGAALVLGSYLFQGQEWSGGLHVIVDGELRQAPPAALSAAFALFRRLSTARRTFTLTRTAESSAIFDGLSVHSGAPATSLCAVPILRRAGRIAGELILVDTEPDRFASLDDEALGALAECTAAALENALKFARAKKDQDRLHLFAEATEEALWDWSFERDEIWWGGGIENLLGRGGATIEISSRWKFGRIHPSDVERVQQSLKRALDSVQSSWREEYRFRRADGSWAVVEDRGYFLREADGRAYRIIGALRDITELKKSNNRLRILSEISRTFAQATLTSTGAFDLIAQTVTETLGEVCAIRILSDDGARLETVGFHDVSAEPHSPRRDLLKKLPSAGDDGFAGEALRTRQPLLLQSVRREQLEALVRAPLFRELWSDATTIMAAPMLVSGDPVGALVMSRRGPVPFTAEDSMLLQDIADRAALAIAHVKQTRAIERSERRFRSLAEASAEVVWTTAPDGRVVEDSPSWRAFTGQTLQQWLGSGWFEALHPEDRERVDQAWSQAVAQKAHVEMEYRVRRPDGSYTWTAARAAPVLNEDGSVREWIGTNTDITEKKRVEDQQKFLVSATAALAESLNVDVTLDKAAQVAVSSIADWCNITLLDGQSGKPRRVTLTNRDAARALQLRTATEGLLGEDRFSLGTAHVLRTGEAQLLARFEEAHVRAIAAAHPGIEAVVREFAPRSLLAIPMRVVGGRILGAITLVTTDESRRNYGPSDLAFAEEFARRCAIAIENAQLFQQAQEAIEARDEFLAIASHELKTPLTPLLLQVHTLEKKIQEYARDEKQAWLAQRLSRIGRQSDRLNRLISQLLDLSRIVGGRLQLEPELVDVTALVQEVVADFKEQGELTRARSEVQLQLDGSVVGRWDRIRLEQVITNLLSNALKYGSGGPVTVSATVHDGIAQLTVEDRGIGIAPQDQERIFGRFERAVSVRHYGGLGLGLFIVWQIVEAMGGSIRVVSALGEGAKFTVQLPLTGTPIHGTPL